MSVSLKRAYDAASPQDGYRVLVDKLWPRGVSKAEARLDDWLKEVAPSDELRSAFHHEQLAWDDFRRRYLSELKQHRETLRELAQLANERKVTLVYSAKDERHNNAVVLKHYLAMLGDKQVRGKS
ncbi:DUF488 domain-containing protein [Oceanisphaera sp.]|uniref:DUF488 domain-containing protein n=1 Tax=Oceanisphaera sp. TaxID=1929979 RepID=UPI003A91898F